jgi:flagellar FliL protein
MAKAKEKEAEDIKEDDKDAAKADKKDKKDDAKEEGGEEGGEEGAEGEGGSKKSKKKIIIMGIVALVVLLGAGAGLYFSGILKHKEEVVATGEDGKPIEVPVYYTLPEFLVNLTSAGKQTSFLKTTVIIELTKETDVPLIEANLPRLLDSFNTYLRELRSSDLAGSAGIQRLREELLLRANKALAPIKINDVLFKEIIVQ